MKPTFRKVSSLYIYMLIKFFLERRRGDSDHSTVSGSVGNVMSLCHLRYIGRKGRTRYLTFDALDLSHIPGFRNLS